MPLALLLLAPRFHVDCMGDTDRYLRVGPGGYDRWDARSRRRVRVTDPLARDRLGRRIAYGDDMVPVTSSQVAQLVA